MSIIKEWGLIAGVGGIALGVVLILFREIIRKAIFPMMTKKQGFITIIIFMILVWFIAIFSLWIYFVKIDNSHSEFKVNINIKNDSQLRAVDVFNWWYNRHGKKYISKPNTDQKFITVWDQWFEMGRILYLVTDAYCIVFNNRNSTYQKYPTPQFFVTTGPGNTVINKQVVEKLLKNTPETLHEKYWAELDRRYLLGGIGIIYLRENLLPKIGRPLEQEHSANNILYAKSDNYEVYAGILNREGDGTTNAVYVLNEDNSFKKYTKYQIE